MEDSSSNSDIKMIDISDEESFEFHFNNVFKQNEPIPDSSDDEGIYKNPEHTKNTKKETGEVNKIITEEKIVDIKNSKMIIKNVESQLENIIIPSPIFKVSKNILFHAEDYFDYYKKYTSQNSIFNVWKNKESRKEKSDEIRKKIKSRFFKSLKNCINDELNKISFPYEFEFLPQNFISNISKNENKIIINKTLKEIILDNKEDNSEKCNNNIKLLEYLNLNKNNKEIGKIYNIFNQTFQNLFSEYLESKEFKNSIIKLKEEGNYFDYIKDYIDKAKDFVNYFSKSN